MKKELKNIEKAKKYLDGDKVKKNIESFYNDREKFLKEANVLKQESFASIIKETLKNMKNKKKNKKKKTS